MNEKDAARVAELMVDVRRLFQEHVTGRGDSPGLPLTTIVVLREIGRESGTSVSGIGRRTGLSKGYISVTIDQMEADGLVEKRPDPDDQRRVCIRLTEKGDELYTSLGERYHGFWAELLEGVSEDEGAAIVGGLERLRAVLARQEAGEPADAGPGDAEAVDTEAGDFSDRGLKQRANING